MMLAMSIKVQLFLNSGFHQANFLIILGFQVKFNVAEEEVDPRNDKLVLMIFIAILLMEDLGDRKAIVYFRRNNVQCLC